MMLLGCSASGRAVMVDDIEVETNVDAGAGLVESSRSPITECGAAGRLTFSRWIVAPNADYTHVCGLSVDTLHALAND